MKIFHLAVRGSGLLGILWSGAKETTDTQFDVVDFNQHACAKFLPTKHFIRKENN